MTAPLKTITIWLEKATFVAFLVAIAAAYYVRFVLAPKITGFDKNFTYSANVISRDNFYDVATLKYIGEQYSLTHFAYEVIGEENDNLLIKNIFDVRTPDGDKIFSVERIYGIEPTTGQHIPSMGDRTRSGYLFAPKHLAKHDFVYWHINYDEPALMSFKNEELLNGLKVYLYESNYHADQTKNLTYLPEVGKTKGVELDIQLKLWIEPISGRLINYQDTTTAYFYDLETKDRLFPWNKFTNTFNQDSIGEQVELAKSQITLINIYEIYLPVILVILGLVFLLLFFGKKLPYINQYFYYIIPLLFLSIFIAFFVQSKNIIYRQKNVEFNQDTNTISNAILERMRIYKNILEGTHGLFKASVSVERAEFKKYIESLNLQNTYPGIQGIGFSKYFSENELVKLVKKVKSEGYPDFKVFPESTSSAYTSIIYLEPLDTRNKRALGFDMTTEPTRKEALDLARDTGHPTLTGKVTLLQEDVNDIQSGFLFFVPVFKNNTSIKTLSDRQKNLEGFVFSPFRMHDFMDSVLNTVSESVISGIDVEIYDGINEINENTELYDKDKGEFSKNPSYKPLFKKTRTIFIQGHPWTLRFIGTPINAVEATEEAFPYLILVGGIIFSASISILIYTLTSAKRNAEILAQTALSKNEAVIASISEGLIITDKTGVISYANEEAVKLLGFEKAELEGKMLSIIAKLQNQAGDMISETERPVTLAITQKQTTRITLDKNYFYLKKDGSRLPIVLTVSPVVLQDKVLGAVEIFRDVTLEKNANKKIEERKDELERMNKLMIGRELKMIDLKNIIKNLRSRNNA